MFFTSFRLIFRSLRSNLSTTLLNTLGLTLGLTAVIIIGLFIRHDLSADRNLPDQDRIYRLICNMCIGENENHQAGCSRRMAPDLHREVQNIEAFTRMLFDSDDTPVRIQDESYMESNTVWVDSAFFQVFGLPLAVGNLELALTRANTAVLTSSTARRYFGDEDPIGKEIILYGDQSYEITGVMDDIAFSTHLPELHILCSWNSQGLDDNTATWLSGMRYMTYFLLRDGASAELTQQTMEETTARYAGRDLENIGGWMRLKLQPVTDIYLNPYGTALINSGSKETLLQFTIVGLFILVIASLNFINLMTARSTSRSRQIVINKVLGSTRSSLIRTVLLESTLHSLLALLLASILTFMSLPYVSNILGMQLTFNPFLDIWLGLTMIGGAVGLGVLVGLYPGFVVTGFRPVDAIRGQLKSGQKGKRIRSVLVTLQFTLSVILIVCTLGLIHLIHFIRDKELGFDSEQVMVLSLGNDETMGRHEIIRTRMEAIPGVVDGCSGDILPNEMFIHYVWHIPGTAETEFVPFVTAGIGYDYLDLFRIPVLQGRNFNRDISLDAEGTIIVNETMAEYLGWENPLGQHLEQIVSNDPVRFQALQVVGVVEDFHCLPLNYEIPPLILSIYNGNPYYLFFRLQTENLSNTLAEMRDVWDELAPALPMDFRFVDSQFDIHYQQELRMGRLLNGFTVLSIVIACLGLFSMVVFTVENRIREIGVRKVLGAGVFSLILLITREFFILIAVANVFAWPVAAYVLLKFQENYAYHPPLQLWLFPVAGVCVLLIALLTIGGKAYHAANKNPIDVLRIE